MPSVIVPLDGSARAETAIPHARALAAGGRITLLTARWAHDGLEARTYLEARAGEMPEVGIDIKVIDDRGPAEAILVVADAQPDAIVCMATRGRGGLAEEILGSVAASVVRDSSHPVLLVGPRVAAAPDVTAPVVVAVDSPSTAATVAPVAAALATSFSVGVRSIEVAAPAPVPLAPDVENVGWSDEGDASRAVVAALDSLGVIAESSIVRAPDPADAIVKFIADRPASFVVVATHARKGLARVMIGSVATRVVHRSPCAVFVVRP